VELLARWNYWHKRWNDQLRCIELYKTVCPIFLITCILCAVTLSAFSCHPDGKCWGRFSIENTQSFLKSVPTSTAFQKVILHPVMGYPFSESAHRHTELLSAGPWSQWVSSFLLLNSTDQRATSSGQLPGGTEGNTNTRASKSQASSLTAQTQNIEHYTSASR